MALFKKKDKSIEIIDLTELQRKGILQKSQQIEKNNEAINSKEGYVDLSNLALTQSHAESISTQPKEIESPEFLSSLANIGANEDSAQITNQAESSKELNQLKLKMEDLEYKLDSFIERLTRLEEKLNNS